MLQRLVRAAIPVLATAFVLGGKSDPSPQPVIVARVITESALTDNKARFDSLLTAVQTYHETNLGGKFIVASIDTLPRLPQSVDSLKAAVANLCTAEDNQAFIVLKQNYITPAKKSSDTASTGGTAAKGNTSPNYRHGFLAPLYCHNENVGSTLIIGVPRNLPALRSNAFPYNDDSTWTVAEYMRVVMHHEAMHYATAEHPTIGEAPTNQAIDFTNARQRRRQNPYERFLFTHHEKAKSISELTVSNMDSVRTSIQKAEPEMYAAINSGHDAAANELSDAAVAHYKTVAIGAKHPLLQREGYYSILQLVEEGKAVMPTDVSRPTGQPR
jgi:hypothetical protein